MAVTRSNHSGFTYTNCENFDPNSIQFGEVKANKKGGNMLIITDKNTGSAPNIKFPKLFSPFEYNKNENPDSSIDFSVSFNQDQQGKVKQFVQNLENALVEEVFQRSEELLGAPAPKETVLFNLKSLLRSSNNYPENEPKLRCKIPGYVNSDNEDVLNPPAFDMENNMHNLAHLLKKKSQVRFIASPLFVWFMGSTFGITLQMQSAKVQQSPSSILAHNPSLLDDEEDEKPVENGKFDEDDLADNKQMDDFEGKEDVDEAF